MSVLANRRHLSIVFLIAAIALVAGLLAATTATKAEAVGEDSGGVFVPVTPVRIADTPSGLNTSATPIPSGGSRTINVLGVGGIPSTGVGAVVLDVAGRSNAGAAVYAYSAGTTRGGSFLKVDANDGWDSNTVIVKPGDNGKVTFYNSYGNTDINVDVQGYFTSVSGEGSPGGFVPIAPARILSTSDGIGLPSARLNGGSTTEFQVGGVGDIPADATAIFGNVRVYDSNYDGGLKLLASNATVGTFTSLNFVEDEFNDTGLSIKLGPDGKIKVIMNGSGTNTAHLKIDVQGYFTPDPESGGSFSPLTQGRIFDSRSTVPIPANSSIEVPVAGLAGVPDIDSIGSVLMSVLALNWQSTGSVRIYNADNEPPTSTNIAFTAPYDRDVISTSVVELSAAGNVVIQNLSSGSVDIILDAQGWFSREVPTEAEQTAAANGAAPVPDGYETMADTPEAIAQQPAQDAIEELYALYDEKLFGVRDSVQGALFAQSEPQTIDERIAAAQEVVHDLTDVPIEEVLPEPQLDPQEVSVSPKINGGTIQNAMLPAGICSPMPGCTGQAFNLPLRWSRQSNCDYCGPASTAMALRASGASDTSAANGSHQMSQGLLASSAYLNTDNTVGGTSIAKIPGTLRKWANFNTIVFYRPSAASLPNIIRVSMKGYKRATVFGTRENSAIGHYNNHPNRPINHFIAGYGFDNYGRTIRYADPVVGAGCWSTRPLKVNYMSATKMAAHIRPYGVVARDKT